MKDQVRLKWENPCLIEFANSKRKADGEGDCNPTGAGAAECFTGYSALAFCGTGGDGQA